MVMEWAAKVRLAHARTCAQDCALACAQIKGHERPVDPAKVPPVCSRNVSPCDAPAPTFMHSQFSDLIHTQHGHGGVVGHEHGADRAWRQASPAARASVCTHLTAHMHDRPNSTDRPKNRKPLPLSQNVCMILERCLRLGLMRLLWRCAGGGWRCAPVRHHGSMVHTMYKMQYSRVSVQVVGGVIGRRNAARGGPQRPPPAQPVCDRTTHCMLHARPHPRSACPPPQPSPTSGHAKHHRTV